MKRKAILRYMEGSPLQQSIDNGTLEELLAFRQNLDKQIKLRKASNRRTYRVFSLAAIVITSIFAGATNANYQLISMLTAAGQLLCAVFWLITYGNTLKKALAMEKVMITLVDASIEKRGFLSPAITDTGDKKPYPNERSM